MTDARAAPLSAEKDPSPQRRLLEFAFGFSCVFGGLMVPSRGLGPLYVSALARMGNWLLPGVLASGVELHFKAGAAELQQAPWTLPLSVTPPHPHAALSVPIDVRALLFVPLACFTALAIATPLGDWRKNARLLGLGLLVLQPVLALLTALPVLSFLGGTGPVQAFELGRAAHTVLQIAYRALVAPPAMAFALPLLLWWVLLKAR